VINITKTGNLISVSQKDESKRINSKLYNIDTNNYENIIYNKKQVAIDLLNKLDNSIMSISSDIIRNYLVKSVVYKMKNRILEIQVNQNNLLVSLHRDAKQFDVDNRLFIRKGYEKNSICYSIIVEDNITCDYISDILNKFYKYQTMPYEKFNDKLFNILKLKVNSISESITLHNTNKGLMFKDKRNFAMLSQTNYGIYVKLLNVADENNILNIVTRKNYEPLCRSYKVKDLSDVDIIIPFIKKSYELNKINPIGLKHEFFKYYVNN
jgi:predicted transport protein